MSKIFIIVVGLLILHKHASANDSSRCPNLKITYIIDKNVIIYPGDSINNLVILGSNNILLHIGYGIEGHYNLYCNDSLFFSGNLKEDPLIGYNKETFILPRMSNMILKLHNVKTGEIIKVLIDSKWKHIVLNRKNECEITVNYRDKSPFRG